MVGDRCTAGFRSDLCPLWVIHDRCGRSHESISVRFCPKADKGTEGWLSPLSAYAAQQGTVSLDHFVGALLEKPRNVKAKRLGGLEIEHQFELRRLLHR